MDFDKLKKYNFYETIHIDLKEILKKWGKL